MAGIRTAEQARHRAFDNQVQQQPVRMSVRRLVNEACAQVAAAEAEGAVEYTASSTSSIDDLDRTTVLQMRAAAAADHALIHTALEVLGETDTRRLYTNRLVDLALTTAAQQPAPAAF